MSALTALRKFVVPESIFGVGARHLVGRYAKSLKMQKILLVSDRGVHQAGWTEEASQNLKEAGLQLMPFLQISPNPRDTEVMNGAKLCKDAHCDGIVAIGGGSVIDAAKGIGIVASNGGSILQYEGVDKILRPMPPLIAIPTTAGTSADISQFAIINDTLRHVKIAIISKSAVADLALVDPETLLTMPPVLTACTGLDALTHAIEAYVSNASSPLTDGHATHAIQLLWSHLRTSYEQPQNLEARAQVMLASMVAGMAFSNASLGCVHAMAHSLGGAMDLPHGECNAILLPHVVAYNYEHAPERYDNVLNIFGISNQGMNITQKRNTLVHCLIDLKNALGIDWTLKDRGVHSELIESLSEHAIHDPCNATNPRRPTQSDLAQIYLEAL